jgi:3-methylcrotonyl-CoA carboxylase alpha subunit
LACSACDEAKLKAPFPSILIANRGEIACRIIRTAKNLGMHCIVVYSDADRDALFVKMADEAHEIGPAPPSYLAIDKIIAAAKRSGASCIHPGYGFLSERAEFAEACAAAGIVFIGPPPSAIRAMGLKDAAKTLVSKAGVPIVPGYHGVRQELEFLKNEAVKIGYPVLIKAIAGGGGKGLRRVDRIEDFQTALEGAGREAAKAFGESRVLIEKYVASPRHIEIQIFGDQHGNMIHLFERDCSLQRRHQKVIEEAPAPGMTEAMRSAMGKAAVDAARAVGYVGAGTVEFIVDGRNALAPDRFWFMEMNTRLQVEHPVTEAITGLDLVEWQLRIAAGEELPLAQNKLRIMGHAFEARLYAEDPENNFRPSTGILKALQFPDGEGIRIDTGVEAGDGVTPFYDPMIAKIIAHGANRAEALDRLSAALAATVLAGPKTNIGFLRKICQSPEFRNGSIDTSFIDANLEDLGAVTLPADPVAIEAGIRKLLISAVPQSALPWDGTDSFQLLGQRKTWLAVDVEGERKNLSLTWSIDGPWLRPQNQVSNDLQVVEDRPDMLVLCGGRQMRIGLHQHRPEDASRGGSDDTVVAPMHGTLASVLVKLGDQVEKGQLVAIFEAMKMETLLLCPCSGEVILVAPMVGAQIASGAQLIKIKPNVRDAA